MTFQIFKPLAIVAIISVWLPIITLAIQDSSESISSVQSSYQNYKKLRRAEFENYSNNSHKDFEAWKKNKDNAFESYTTQIAREWGAYVGSTNQTWVEYRDNERSRSVVDFKKGIVTVEVLVEKARALKSSVTTQLEKAVRRTVTSRGVPQKSLVSAADTTDAVLPTPVLANQIINANGAIVSSQNADSFANQIVTAALLQKVPAGDSVSEIYSLSFPLVPDHLAKRMAPYLPLVKKYCAVYELNVAQVLALIHTESYFNPLARSTSNAIGLMQIIPQQGAAEAYRFISNNATVKVPAWESLFDPETNIRLGCAYLYVLKTRDFGEVVDKDRTMYCSIASYNGGPASVALAFTGDSKIPPAIRSINAMNDANSVYLFLIRNLPAAETRQYLENVVARTRLYE